MGTCWDMSCSDGQLGISLAHPVVITHVMIDHIPQEFASDIEQAPKLAVLWGAVDSKANWDKTVGLEIMHPIEFGHLLSLCQGPPAAGGLTYICTASIHLIWHIQRGVDAEIPCYTGDSTAKDWFRRVVFEVLDNWGGTSTCLYQVCIHSE